MLNQPLEGEVGDHGQRIGRTQSQSSSRRTESLGSLGGQDESASAEAQRSVAGTENQPVTLAPSDDTANIGRDISVPQSESMATIRLTPQDQDAIERVCD